MMIAQEGRLVPAGTGPEIRFGPVQRAEVKAADADGLGFGLFRSRLPQGGGMPFLHVHRSIDDAFEVLAGKIEYRLGDRSLTAESGDAVLVPRGVSHCFRALGDGAEVLVLGSPATAVDMVAGRGPRRHWAR